MANPEVALGHILQLAEEEGPDDKGRYTIGKMNAKMIVEGFTGADWKAGIAAGEKAGKLKMDPCGSFFTMKN